MRAALLAAVLAGALACTGDPPQPPPASTPEAAAEPASAPSCCLRQGETIRGRLEPGARDAFEARLDRDDVLEVLADQGDADLVLVVTGSGGSPRHRFDSPDGQREPEHLLFAATEPGRYLLEVASLPSAPAAAYHLEVVTLGPTKVETRRRAATATAVADAHELRRAGHCDEAAARYDQAAKVWAALDDVAAEADALDWRAYCLLRTGDPEEAAGVLARAIEGFRASGNDRRKARALEELGTALRRQGQTEEALERYQEALGLWRGLQDIPGEAGALTQIANLHKGRNELSAAELRYQEAIRLWAELDSPRDQALTLANLAGIYSVVGHAEVALDLLRHASSILPPSAGPEDRAFLLEEQGLARRRLGETQEAIALYRRALTLRRELGLEDAAALDGLARLQYEAGDYDSASDLYREAVTLAEKQGDRRREASFLDGLAWVDLRSGRASEALDLFQRVLPVLQEVDFPAGEASALGGIARVERSRGNLEAAAAWAERSLDVLEEIRTSSDRLELRASLVATRQDSFDFTVDTLMELHRRDRAGGYAAEAFHVSERARARWLLDALPAGEGKGEPGPDADLAPLRERVNAAAQERLHLLQAEAGDAALRRAERTLRSALEDLRTATARSRRRGGASPRELEPLRLAEIQKTVLGPDTLLLSYDLGEKRSYLWAVSADAVEPYVLPAGAEIDRLARAVHRLLSHSQERGASELIEMRTEQLAKALLSPARSQISRYRRLLVSVDGALHAVPFGALPDPTGHGLLLESHEILYTPSASVYAWLSRRPDTRRKVPGKLLAVLADPVFGPADERVRPSTGGSMSAGPSDATVLGGGELPRLPETALEAEAVLGIVPAEQRFAARGFEARKELVTSGALSGFRILHFATHGWFSPNHPELSALVLSQVDRRGRPRDGVLWAHEIATQHLAADLVVLSACDTGLGAEIEGEGLVGLTHAFFRAGAPRVLASLWRVDDRAAADLMGEFYRGYLREGLAPAEALRRAQLSVRSKPEWSRPYYWEGFVLLGRS